MSRSRTASSVAGLEWGIWQNDDGTFQHDQARLAVLMDIRRELQRLNNVMQCRNVSHGFKALAKIASRDERAFKRRVEHAVAKRLKRAK